VLVTNKQGCLKEVKVGRRKGLCKLPFPIRALAKHRRSLTGTRRKKTMLTSSKTLWQ